VAELGKALPGVTIEEKSVTEAINRALMETGLSCPGIELEHWVSAVLKIRQNLLWE